jgi:DNA repair exonuclease SbcCD ATPase subunit
MANKIKQLVIEGFRGASRPFLLDFDENKPVTLIFGENGTGKSTLVDAVECIAKGTTSFKDNWKLGQGQRKDGFIPTIGRKPDEVSLGIQYGGMPFKATSANTTAHIPSVHVLRRRSLQAYIEADAAERYKVIAEFMDIPEIESSEASLREASKNAGRAVELATAAITQAEEGLNDQWEAAGSPGLGDEHKDAEAWARKESAADPAVLQNTLNELSADISVIEKMNRSAERVLSVKAELKQAQQAKNQAEQSLKEVEKEAERGSAGLATLLKDAMDYLKKTPDELCPVCEETRIDAPKLVERLNERLDEMATLNHASKAVQDAAKTQQGKETLYHQAASDFLGAAEKAIDRYGKELSQTKEFGEYKETDPEKAVEIGLAVNQELSRKLSGLRDKALATQKQLHTLSSIRKFVQTLDGKKAELESKSRLHDSLAKAVEVYAAKRKAYIKEVLKDIGQSVDALYQQIHPEEGIGKLKLSLDERKRASLDYKVRFADEEEVQPQPYYSESHLDTLGLCIFLALARRSSGKDAIIILDDVLVSVDQQHLHRTVDMLIAESANLAQIIMTTHYRPLRNRFTNSRTGSNLVQLIDLKPWTLAEGVRFNTPKLATDELEAALANDDFPRTQIAIDAGRLLENAFDYLTLLYGSRMSRKPEPKYDLGELFSAVRGIKDWQMTDGSDTTEIKPLLETLQPLLPVRNEAGAHYNEAGEQLSDADIAEFGKVVLELLKTLICSACNGLAQKQDNMGHWKCQCGQTTMKPYRI